MENKYIAEIREFVTKYFKDDKVKIFLFGSRARKDNHTSSDIDIGIVPYGEVDEKKITLLREQIENLNTPYRIEIVNFLEVSEDFKREALKEATIWKD